jgi:TonB family protein
MKRMLIAAALCGASPGLAQPAVVDTGRVYSIAEVDSLPRATNVAEFRAALADGFPADVEGAEPVERVVVTLRVDAVGAPHEVGVMESTDARFDSATVAAARLLRFTPGLVGGRPVAVRLVLPIQWQTVPDEPADSASAPAADPPTDDAGEDAAATEPEARDSSPKDVPGPRLDVSETPPRIRNQKALLRQLELNYPPNLRGSGVRGVVRVRIRVNEQGQVTEASVTRSTNLALDEATVRAVRVLRFHPATLNGRPVATWVELPIEWPAFDVQRVPAMP